MFRRLKEWFLEYTRTQPAPSVVFPPDTSLIQLEGFLPENFSWGVEILNDNETSIEFVVSALQEHAGMNRRAALLAAANIHIKGGIVLERNSLEQAERLSASIERDARAAHFPLICRVITAQQRAAGHVRNART